MQKEKRHISTEKKLIIGIVVSILIFAVSLYIFNNHIVGTSIINNIPALVVGVIVFIIVVASFFATCGLIGILFSVILSNHYAKKSYLRSKEQIKALPNNFVNVHFKDFDSFRLASFVDSEDITCFAKLDEKGKVVYAIQLNIEYETDDYETFLRHFDI